jgi:hypothetical protein
MRWQRDGKFSHPELPQVMIQVLVHQDSPFVGSEGAEERMRMTGAAGRACCSNAANEPAEARLRNREVGIVLNHELF